MPRGRPTSSKLPANKQSKVEFSKLADQERERLVTEFEATLRFMAECFMERRGSRTLDATDIANAYAWLTRPARKAVVRDTIASVVVLLAAVVVGYGVNGLFATPVTKGAWSVVVIGVLFSVFAEVFRRWEYN